MVDWIILTLLNHPTGRFPLLCIVDCHFSFRSLSSWVHAGFLSSSILAPTNRNWVLWESIWGNNAETHLSPNVIHLFSFNCIPDCWTNSAVILWARWVIDFSSCLVWGRVQMERSWAYDLGDAGNACAAQYSLQVQIKMLEKHGQWTSLNDAVARLKWRVICSIDTEMFGVLTVKTWKSFCDFWTSTSKIKDG